MYNFFHKIENIKKSKTTLLRKKYSSEFISSKKIFFENSWIFHINNNSLILSYWDS